MTFVGLASVFWNPSLKLAMYWTSQRTDIFSIDLILTQLMMVMLLLHLLGL